GMFTISAFLRSQKEKDYRAIAEANHAIVKEGLKCDFTYEQSCQQIMSRRRLAAGIKQLFERGDASADECYRWIQEYGLHGLVELPQIQQAVIEQPRRLQGSIIPNPNIASVNEDAVQEIINPGVMAVLQELAAQYPEYIRLDDRWVDELCDSSSCQNMSNRANHHFSFWGETQSGKSTLAGVFINKIAAKSQGAALVFGSDPKNYVTRWLCKFSRKFDGFKENLDQWVTFATKIIDARQEQFKDNRKGEGLNEIFLIQDEVNVVYGEGKGLPGQVPKETALNLCAMWNYIINFTAAMKIHGIFMGQNPLSGFTGFSRPALKNICFICLGKVSSYVLGNPTGFLNVKPEVIDLLKNVCELLDKQSVRYALVVPTRGNPCIALIPIFDIDALEEKTQSQDTFGQEDQKIGNTANWYEILTDWVQQLERNPTDSQLIEAWKKVTGIELTSDALQLLKNKLELTDEAVTWATITADLQLPEKWKEEDLQKAIASRLIGYGYKAQTEVECNGGFIDIFTDFNGGTIVEVKKYLTRDTIYQAAGQLHLYGGGNRYKLLAMGFLPSNEGDQQQAKTTASMVSQDERISCLFIK
ncbi:MAG: hypothetical protein ACKPKT_05600, partial [Dolichospermum sp.]